MSELKEVWLCANNIADDINVSGNLNWSAHMRGLINLGKQIEKENTQLKARVFELYEAMINIRDCQESELQKYVISVDSIVCEITAKHDDYIKQLKGEE